MGFLGRFVRNKFRGYLWFGLLVAIGACVAGVQEIWYWLKDDKPVPMTVATYINDYYDGSWVELSEFEIDWTDIYDDPLFVAVPIYPAGLGQRPETIEFALKVEDYKLRRQLREKVPVDQLVFPKDWEGLKTIKGRPGSFRDKILGKMEEPWGERVDDEIRYIIPNEDISHFIMVLPLFSILYWYFVLPYLLRTMNWNEEETAPASRPLPEGTKYKDLWDYISRSKLYNRRDYGNLRPGRCR